MILTVLLLFLPLTLATCPVSDEPKPFVRGINYRLPQNVAPHRYHVSLEPDLRPNLNPAPFNGSVLIELQVLQTSKNVTLHTRQLNVTESSIQIKGRNGVVKVSGVSRDEVREFYIIHVNESLVKGEWYNLTIGRFDGILNLQNAGFYLAKYWDREGRERRFATTQFQSTSARRAFPCFDEPHMKATFVTHLVRTHNFTSISNGELLYTKSLGNGRYEDTFEETVPMSTYLTAFVVSDYGYAGRKQGQRVFGEADSVAKGHANFSLDIGIEILNALENFTRINYSLSKMDQIGIPDNYFAPGAMENWGLVTYRTSYLLYPYENATTNEIQSTVDIIAHEFAHQWFGNLVTCSWWKYIWLNEGFANYFQRFAAYYIRPSWRGNDDIVLASVQPALSSDSTNSTKPMNYEQEYPGGGPPSYVAYSKAGAVIRMFENFLTSEVFRNGLTLYLRKNAYQAVEPSDLYEALQKALGSKNFTLLGNFTVAEIMETWDSQAGYPIVNVTRDYSRGGVVLNQRRFFSDGTPVDYSLWIIPINFQTQNDSNLNTTADYWMKERSDKVNKTIPSASWLILNKQQTGFYRVTYDDRNWELIARGLQRSPSPIHILNRAQLLDDSYTLARIGQLPYYIPLNISKYLRLETDFVPIKTFLNAQSHLDKMLAASPYSDYYIYQRYINNLLQNATNFLGFDEKPNDENMDKRNRIDVLYWLCYVGNTTCQNIALNKLRRWRDNNVRISPDLEHPVLTGAIRSANQSEWNFLYQKYEVAGNTSQRRRILRGLASSENATILSGLLDKVNPNSTLRKDDYSTTFSYALSSSRHGLNATFTYIYNHYPRLDKLVNIRSILNSMADRFSTQRQLIEMTNLINTHVADPESYAGILKAIENNIAWSNKYLPSITSWLSSNPV